MKLVLGLLLAFSTHAFATTAPYSAKLDARLKAIELVNSTPITESLLPSNITDGLNAKRVAKAHLNCASSGCSLGAHGLGVTLPANTMITRSYIYVKTQLVDSGTCTVAISCEDANNIKTATDLTGTAAGGFIEGASTGAASAFVAGIAAACEITATVADGGSCVPSAGYLDVYVEYVVKD